MINENQHQSVTQQEDNCSSEDGDFVQLDQPKAVVMDVTELQRHLQQAQNANGLTENWPSFGTTAVNGNDLNELKWKMALLEAKNQMLETKVENVELRAKMRDKSMERKLEESEQRIMQISKELANLNAERPKEKQIHLEDAQAQQQKGEMENTDEMPEFAKKLTTSVEEKYQSEITELKVKNQALMEENKTFEQNLKMANDKLEECIQHKKKEQKMAELDTKVAASIQLGNPNGISWKGTNGIKISQDGLIATSSNRTHIPKWNHLFANRGFTISTGENTHAIVYYFEVTQKERAQSKSNSNAGVVGLTNGNIPDDQKVQIGNAYVISKGYDDDCYTCLCGLPELILWPKEVMKPVWKGHGDILGCGLLQTPSNKAYIFFTGNGILMGNRLFPIKNPANYLIPVVAKNDICLEGNFGDNPAKSFKFDINKCLAFLME